MANFFRRREWLQRLNDNFDVGGLFLRPFSACPTWLRVEYRAGCQFQVGFIGLLFPIDLAFSRRFPRFCAAFFTVTLTRR